MKTYKVGSIELTQSVLENAIQNNQVAIIGHRTAWSLRQGTSGIFQIVKAYTERGKQPLMPRGRFMLADAKRANKLIGFELFTA